MIDKKVLGFVINKVNYKDNDAIYKIATSSGIYSFKARSILKANSKNASACNYFTLSNYLLTSKTENSYYVLKEASLAKMYKRPLEDLEISLSYIFICNLLNHLPKEYNGYDLAIKCFDLLETAENNFDVLNYFLKYYIISLGYKPNLCGCVNCGKKDNLFSFSFESGGFICNSCLDTSRHKIMDKDLLKHIHQLFKSDELYLVNRATSITIFKLFIDFLKLDLNINVDVKLLLGV